MSMAAGSILVAFMSLANASANLVSGVRDDSQQLGSCIGQRGPVILSKVLFLENRSVDWTSSSGPIRITLRRQWVHIEPLNAREGHDYPRDISQLVAKKGEAAADIFVKLALLDSAPVVYWRETFQNRIYRQGLFKIDGQQVELLCEGEAGQTILD